MAHILPYCAPPARTYFPPNHCGDGTASNAQRLCHAVTTILERASCDELSSHRFLGHLIERIGLAGDLRGERIYGAAKKYMRRIGSHSGLWQDPQQISAAILALGSKARRHSPPTPFTYVEVGVYTAWTTAIISAYLTRTGAGAPFSGLAVDVKVSNIASSTLELLTRLNVTFLGRNTFDKKIRNGERLLGSASRTGPQFDLCFIDGDHGYGAVTHDYEQLAPHCGSAMFHDIQDLSTVLSGDYSGGVPLFWAQARSRVLRSRTLELTKQYAPYWPVFGIGIIWAGASGTAEPDDGSSVSTWPASKGAGAAALWRTICGGTPRANGARLPPMYVQRELVCAVATEANMEQILAATKRTVPRPALEFATSLPWNTTRARLEVAADFTPTEIF